MEEELLKILERDARISKSKIAEMLGVTEEEVKKKIKEFEEKGIIRKYKTVINWEKFGKEKVYALIDVKVTPQRDKGYDSVAERIMRFPEVKNLYLVSGLYDLSVLVQGDSMKEVASFVAEKLAPLEQVQSTTTHFLLKIYKEEGDILVEKEKNKRLAITP
ncbi:MAG: Lrp/AsnC family transcriptional regulator [Candidatus Hydrothermarchaeota archaeon]|nr:MAG: Lrp/AsnC family transcriptional regulator [Candidatus Hydrothermarchaeota archaeon]